MKKAADKTKAAKRPRPEKERGADADRPKQVNWRDVMTKALEKKRPAEGWPDPRSKYEKPNQSKKR
jgi:hypothetical protein